MPKLFIQKDDGTYVETDDFVPRHRFNEVSRELEAAKGQVETMTGDLTTARASATSALEQSQKHQSEIEALRAKHLDDLALVRAGIDDDAGMQFARFYRDSLPEDSRPPLADIVSQWKEDPTKAPKPIRLGYLEGKAGADATAGAEEAAEVEAADSEASPSEETRRQTFSVNGGVRNVNGGGSAARAIPGKAIELANKGDVDALRAYTESLKAELRDDNVGTA